MIASSHKSSVGRIILIGVVYFVVGFGSAALDPSVSDQMRFAWRLSAWIVSAMAFGSHIAFEHFRLTNSPRVTALHAATAVALGALLLAIAATIHKGIVSSQTPYSRFLLALVVWPIVTAVPALVVAFAVAAILAKVPRKRLAE